MPEHKQRLVITGDSLPAVVPLSPHPPAKGLPPNGASVAGLPLPSVAGVRPMPLQVGAMPAVGSASQGWRGTLPLSIIGAIVATVVAWALFELIASDSMPRSDGALIMRTALEFGVFGAVFGAVYSAWDDISSGLWAKVPMALGVGLAIGAVGGAISAAIAQALYSQMVESILAGVTSEGELVDAFNSAEFYFARALAWGLFGVGVGAAVGAVKRSSRKLVNGLIGGVVGGAVGGLFFHYIGQKIDSPALGRLLGFGVVGLGIGAAIGLVELARRQAWMRIVAGGMVGKEFIVYHQSTNVGASPKCEITLIKDPAIGPFHFRIDEHGQRRSLQAYDGCQVAINGAPVTQHWLRNGDVIQAGATAIQFSERVASV